MTPRSILCLLLLATAPIGDANEVAAPPITSEALNGTWEAVVAETGVVRMEIRARGESYLVEANGPGDDGLGVYRLVQRQVHDGKVTLRFAKVRGSWQPKGVTLRGYGYLNGESADLRVKLIQSTEQPGSYDLHLTRGTITQDLAKLSRRARDVI